jgi:mannose-6-phosphate isomerase
VTASGEAAIIATRVAQTPRDEVGERGLELATSHITAEPKPSRAGASAAERAQAWMLDACFPFWAERAPHPRGGFRERVALDGGPLDDDVSRVRVQARQTYVFARAALMGWEPTTARALARRGVESLLGPCRREDKLFGRLVRPGIGLADPQPELYDNAFCIMALAWAARALEAPELVGEADDALTRLGASHAHRAGGYSESLPPRLPRRHNPHMHLFEACTALFESSGQARHLDRARDLLALFQDRFLARDQASVCEHYDEQLRPAAGEPGEIIEPGHAFEWIALIRRFAQLSAGEPPSFIPTLYAGALKTLDADGFTPMGARSSGGIVDAARRTWGQTEALRAHLARAEAGDAAAAARARALFSAIFSMHLDPAPAGAWIDHFDAEGSPCADAITAATGYHLVTAFAEVAESPTMQSSGMSA